MGKYTKKADVFFINSREVNGVKEHRCTSCQEWFPETEEYFYFKNKSNPEKGFGSECRRCTSKRSSNYRKNHHELRVKYDKEYRTQNKDKRKKGFQEWRNNNLEYNYERMKKWGQENPDKVKEYAENRRLHKKHNITKGEWEACKAYFNFTCAYCGLPLSEHYYTRKGITKLGDFHKEHVDNEGSNDLNNCVPSCGSCNEQKWKNKFEEWYNSDNPKYTEERYNKILQWLNNDWVLFADDFKMVDDQ